MSVAKEAVYRASEMLLKEYTQYSRANQAAIPPTQNRVMPSRRVSATSTKLLLILGRFSMDSDQMSYRTSTQSRACQGRNFSDWDLFRESTLLFGTGCRDTSSTTYIDRPPPSRLYSLLLLC